MCISYTFGERMVINMKSLKIAVIGAGSTYTPEMIEGFIRRVKVLNVSDFYMMDIQQHKLEIVSGLAKRMLHKHGINARVVNTTSYEEAIEGADFVLGQIRVGLLDARIKDEKIPLKHGFVGQETTGAGGFANGLRTVPVMMKIADIMDRYAKDAWLINFSNPSGIVAEALLNHTNVKMMGLCNGPINMINSVKEYLPVGTTHFDYDYAGLNHLTWITGVYADGKNIIDSLLSGDTQLNGLANISSLGFDSTVLSAIKGIPLSYLNYYYYKEKMYKQCLEAEKCRGEICKEIEDDLLKLYQDETLCDKPEILSKRGGALYSEAAVSLVDAIQNDKNEIHVVDVKNNGTFSFLDPNDVVETRCLINKSGATPLPLRSFNDPYMIGLVQGVKAYEKLTVEAAISGDYSKALAALMAHPMIGDYNRCKPLLDELIEAHKEYLPLFFK